MIAKTLYFTILYMMCSIMRFNWCSPHQTWTKEHFLCIALLRQVTTPNTQPVMLRSTTEVNCYCPKKKSELLLLLHHSCRTWCHQQSCSWYHFWCLGIKKWRWKALHNRVLKHHYDTVEEVILIIVKLLQLCIVLCAACWQLIWFLILS